MTKHRLDPVLHHANTQQQDLAQRLSSSLQQLRDSESQLEQLLKYRDEYSSKQTGGNAFSVQDLHNQQLFINQVNKAIEQQQQNIDNARRQVQQEKLFWQQSKTRCDAIDELIQKQSKKHKQRAEYREQKENDELNNRRTTPRTGR